jgi:hypothetical protein
MLCLDVRLSLCSAFDHLLVHVRQQVLKFDTLLKGFHKRGVVGGGVHVLRGIAVVPLPPNLAYASKG